MIASPLAMVHTRAVAKTIATWFSSQKSHRRTTATRRYFYVHSSLRTLYGRAIAGRAYALPGSFVSGLLTLHSARPPHLAVDGGPTSQGGRHG